MNCSEKTNNVLRLQKKKNTSTTFSDKSQDYKQATGVADIKDFR